MKKTQLPGAARAAIIYNDACTKLCSIRLYRFVGTTFLLFCLIGALALNSYAGVTGKSGGLKTGGMLKSKGPNTAIANTKAVSGLNKKKSSDGTGLSNLTISAGTLSPVFSSATTSYTATVDNSVSSITITVAAPDPTTDIGISGASSNFFAGSGSFSQPLTEGGVTNLAFTVFGGASGDIEYTLSVTRPTGPPTVSATAAATNITSNSATLGYTLSDNGGTPIFEQGVVYSKNPNPQFFDVFSTFAGFGSDVGIFSSNVTGLVHNTTYYVRGVAENSNGTSYGPQVTFTIPDQAPVVTATSAPVIYVAGSPAVNIASGITITDADDTFLQSVTVTGVDFGDILAMPATGNLSGLFSGNTLTITGNGTVAQYQAAVNTVTFQTASPISANRIITVSANDGILSSPAVTVATVNFIYPPTITTNPATSITQTTAVLSYNVFVLGTGSFSDEGIVYSQTNATPTLADSRAEDFINPVTLLNLSTNATYYARAYAVSDGLPFYGNTISFTTLANAAPTVSTAAATNITDTSATLTNNITAVGGGYIRDYGAVYSTTNTSPTLSDTQFSFGTNEFNTGTFSGTATGLIPNTTYYVAAYATNFTGTGYSSPVSFTTAPANLTGIGLSAGTLSPAFDAATTSYAASVGSGVSSLIITPTANYSNAVITVNGSALANGSATVNLAAGPNTITILLTAGGTSTSYSITVNRAFTPPGNALAFDGVDDGVIMGTPPTAVSGSFTVEAWVMPTNSTKEMHIFSTRSGGEMSFDLQILSGNIIHADIGTGSAWLTTAANGTYNYQTGQWIHLACVVTPTGYSIYANGNQVGNGTLSGTPLLMDNTHTTTIGCYPGENTYFNGSIDEVRVYNAALSQANIQADMVSTASSVPANLVNYYDFDDGAAGGTNTGINTLTDRTTTGYNGTLSNFALSGTTSNWVESYAMVVPTATAATGVGPTGFTANWTAPVTGTVTDYLVDVSTSPTFAPVISGSPFSTTSTSLPITGLSEGNTYYYRVRADKTSVTGEGDNSAVISELLVGHDASLSGLSTSPGTLSPTFAAATTAYADTVSNAITTVSVTAVTNDPFATVSMLINGNGILNGTTANVPVNLGNNTIVITVTAQDGATQSTYNLALFRQAGLPVLTTSAVTDFPSGAVIFGYQVTSTGGATLTDQGIVYSATDKNPTTADTKVQFGSKTGTFAQFASGLQAGTTYYARAYATNATGTAYGNQVSFTTLNTINSITAASPNPTNGPSVNYTVTFAGNITGLSAANFTTTGTANGAVVTSVNGSGAVYTVTVNAGVTDGTLTLNLDNASGLSPGVSTALPFAGDTYTIDRTPPRVTVSTPSAPAIAGGGAGTVSYTVTYADANFNTSNLTSSGIMLNATGTATGIVTVTGAGTSYTVTISNITGAGTLGISVDAGYASDLAGNTDAGAAAPATFFVLSTDATLSNLTLNAGSLTPSFNPGVTSYSRNLVNGVTAVTIVPTSNDPGATILVNGTETIASGATSDPIPVSVGSNTITIQVTAQDGITIRRYTITLIRAGASNDLLSLLQLSAGTKSPVFMSSVFNYTATVGNNVSSMTVTPAATDPNATILVNGTDAVTSGSASDPITLSPGPNTIIVKVTAQDGTDSKTYTVTVTRTQSANANLSTLQLNPGLKNPVFTSPNTSYTASVGNGVSATIVTPTTSDPNATVKVNGITVASGTPSGPITLNAGPNTITTEVTAQDGVTKKTYTVIVTRALGSNDLLSLLKLSAGTKSPVFTSSTTSYTASVGNGVSTITVAPTAFDPNATILVDTTDAVASGATSAPITLAVGSNTITVKVTAQDGINNQTYTVMVTRAAPPSANTVYEPIGVETAIKTPTLAADGIQVHQGVSPNGDGINDFLQIDNISQYPDNKLSIMNRNGQLIYEAKGYDNSSKVFDGHSNKNGQMQLPGTYFYQLDYAVNGIIKHKTGFLVLKY